MMFICSNVHDSVRVMDIIVVFSAFLAKAIYLSEKVY